MGIKFSNNASANITRALTSTATSVSVTTGKGNLFPSLTEGDYFYATLAGNNGLEIVKVTSRVNDTMTIVRAQDNTTALSFDIGDLFELRIVAADFNDTFSSINTNLEETISSVNTTINNTIESVNTSLTDTINTVNESLTDTETTLNASINNLQIQIDNFEAFPDYSDAEGLQLGIQNGTPAWGDFTGAVRDDTVLAAETAADVSGGSLGSVDLNQILSAYDMTQNGLTSVSEELATTKTELEGQITTTKTELEGHITTAVPVGTVIAFAANSTPEGYLLCNGAAVSRTTYFSLFAAIGGTYGSGDGSTTFNLPNLEDRMIQGKWQAGHYLNAGLPNITGVITLTNCYDTENYSGAFRAVASHRSPGADHGMGRTVDFYANRCSSVYGNSSTVQPPALTMRYYIKY